MQPLSELQARGTLDQLSDAELATRVRGGEPALFELIMRRHNRRLFRIARGILGEDAEAEDAVQEAYVSAYFKLEQFRGPDGFGGWLGQIVVNQALGRRRKRLRLVTSSLDVLDEPANRDAAAVDMKSADGSPEAGLHEQQLRRLLEQAIDDLPAAFRTTFVLREIEQLSVADTARVLGIEEATVKSRMHRARRLLQRDLTGEIAAAMRDAFDFGGERCDRIVAGVLARIS